jgi:hypothetical protein
VYPSYTMPADELAKNNIHSTSVMSGYRLAVTVSKYILSYTHASVDVLILM